MYTALYRSERPEVFEEILGQDHIVKILKNQVKTGTLSHAYLFCGTRGTGKTTTARILAKAVNCLSDGDRPCGTCANCLAIKAGTFMDVIEIDAASNRGIENIRELRESVKYPPATGRKKVYVIDEVHMLTIEAFNALLKTLEEPPEHVMFILATTEPNKLPKTILSRCMRLDFRRVEGEKIAENMTSICASREIELTNDAARLLANLADGSVRDGLSILDQVIAGGDKVIDRDKVLEYVGTTGEEFFINLTDYVIKGNQAQALMLLNEALLDGKDVKAIMKDWVSHYRNLLIAKFTDKPGDMINLSSENLEKIKAQAEKIDFADIDFAITKLSKTVNDARWSSNPRVLLELAIVTIANPALAEAPEVKLPVRETVVSKKEESKEQKLVLAEEVKKDLPEEPKTEVKAQREGPKEEPKEKAKSLSKNPEFWDSIFENGAGSLNLIKMGTKVIGLSDKEIHIEAINEFTKGFVETHKLELEELVKRYSGKDLKVICTVESLEEEANDSKVEDLAKEASNLLGIEVTIE